MVYRDTREKKTKEKIAKEEEKEQCQIPVLEILYPI